MNKKVYFASDFHFGIPDRAASRIREDSFVDWLTEVSADAEAIYLMGDLFDFWFEYQTAVPKGFARLFGKLAKLTDQGIPVHLFRGNHDVWAFSYLQDELGIELHREPETITLMGKRFFLAHGDGLGPGDHGYKLLKKVFECRICQILFNWIHPDIGTRMGLYFSKRSRLANIAREGKPEHSKDPESEMILKYARSVSETNPSIDFFVFGHRHLPLDYALNDKARLILLGDWIVNFTYAVFDGDRFELKHYSSPRRGK